MKKHFVLCLSLCLFLSSHPVHAWDEYKDNHRGVPSISEYPLIDKNMKFDCPTCGKIPDSFLKDWEKDITYLNKDDFNYYGKNNLANCDLFYNVLWSWSKKGNLSARFMLLATIAFSGFEKGMGHFVMPTTSWDEMTRKRYLSLLTLYQIGSKEDTEGFGDADKEENRYFFDTFITKINGLEPDSKFGKCMGKERSQKCVEEAVKDGIIPSFDRFAREIDALYAAGFMPICAAGVDPHENALEASGEPLKQK